MYFHFQEIHIYDLGGRLVICAFVLNAFLASLALWCIVRRAKLCLDFRWVSRKDSKEFL